MKKYLISILGSALILGLFLTISSSAQTSTNKTAPNVKSLLLATVNIYNATNTKIDNNTYSISFQLDNRVGIQSDIRYGVELMNKSTGQIADLYLVNQALTLGENQSKDLTLKYSLPGFLSNGSYNLMIVAQNASGLPLAVVPAGYPEAIIDIQNNSKLINLQDCSLFVDASSTNNSLFANLNSNQALTATCKVNNLTNDNNYSLQLITHKGGKFGNILNNAIEQDLGIKKNTNNTINFKIPTLNNPGSYSVDTFLINSKGEKVSPSIYFTYNISGLNVIIQNLILDKDSYKSNDTAKLQLFWNGSSINSNNNLTLDAKIYDNSNNLCGEISKKLSLDLNLSDLNLNIPIARNCPKAIAKVNILSGDQVLANSEIDSNNSSNNININPNIKNISNTQVNKVYILIFILVLVLLAYGILVFKKSANKK